MNIHGSSFQLASFWSWLSAARPLQSRRDSNRRRESRSDLLIDVVPLVNGDYDITVTGDHRASDAELRAAWKAKATDLAAGKGYIISDLAFKSQEHTHYQPMGVFMSFPMTSKNQSLRPPDPRELR